MISFQDKGVKGAEEVNQMSEFSKLVCSGSRSGGKQKKKTQNKSE